MSVEKVTRLRSHLEELRQQRQRLVEEARECHRKIEEIDGIIRRYLTFEMEAITATKKERERRSVKKKK